MVHDAFMKLIIMFHLNQCAFSPVNLTISVTLLNFPFLFCSVEQLKDIGCKWVILGHSERRHIIGEDDQVKLSKLCLYG